MGWPLALATLGAAGISAWGQHRANKASAASAKDMMEFQQYNSDTSVRRAMKDMEAAGINPLLAGKYGASTPGGASYTAQNELDEASGSVGSAIQLKKLKADLENMKRSNEQITSQIELNTANAAKIRRETELLELTKQSERIVQPAADLAADVVESSVGSAREFGSELRSYPYKIAAKVVTHKAKERAASTAAGVKKSLKNTVDYLTRFNPDL